MIVVSPASKLLGLTVDAAGAALRGGLRLLAVPTLIEGRVFAEVLQPTALVVDSGFAEDGQRLLLAAAVVAGATPVLLGGEGELPAGFVARVPADRAALSAWLSDLRAGEVAGPPEGDMLAVVRARYAASLGEKAASMVISAAAVLEGAADPESVEAARRIAHRLRGSAGSYGFPAFGEVAARIDAALLGGLIQPPAASLTRAIEILELWRGGADPLGEAWPRLQVVGGHALVGEVAPIAHTLRVDVEVGADAGEVGAEARPEGSCVAQIIEVEGEPDDGGVGGSARPVLYVGAERAWVPASEVSFARTRLGARLPGLVRGWLASSISGPRTT